MKDAVCGGVGSKVIRVVAIDDNLGHVGAHESGVEFGLSGGILGGPVGGLFETCKAIPRRAAEERAV